MSEKIELLPCPFCGSHDVEVQGKPAILDSLDSVLCNECTAGAPYPVWNTRAPQPQPAADCGLEASRHQQRGMDMTDKQLSAGEAGLEVVGYTAQQDIDWQGDCALRKAPMLDYSIPLVRLSDAQRLLAAARLQTAMLATCAKNVADERDQLRAMLSEQQASRCSDCGYLTSQREHLGCLRKAVAELDAATGGQPQAIAAQSAPRKMTHGWFLKMQKNCTNG